MPDAEEGGLERISADMFPCFPSSFLPSLPTLLTSQTLQVYACNQASDYRGLSSMMLRSLDQDGSYNLGRQSCQLFESWPMVESSSSVHSLAHPQGQCPAYPTWHRVAHRSQPAGSASAHCPQSLMCHTMVLPL